MSNNFIIRLLLVIGLGAFFIFYVQRNNSSPLESITQSASEIAGGVVEKLHPLAIERLREGEYPGSDIVIEQELPAGSNYSRYVALYKSEGLTIYGLLTVPNGDKPATGWPVIIFNHGYIAPSEYRTTERYVAYQDGFARNGYITFKSDYRGHGNSEGQAGGGYGNNDYTIDVLNALASIKKLKDPSGVISNEQSVPQGISRQARNDIFIVDPQRIGMWGHSMGGYITLRSMVVSKDIKAGVIWGGVVASYPDLINNWRRPNTTPRPIPSGARRWRQLMVDEYGAPKEDSPFWKSISANSYLTDISGPLQLHHGVADTSVPVEFSEKLEKQLLTAKKPVELYTYPEDDHDITANFGIAIQRSIEFFDKNVKEL